eukprot:TRINITY_DN7895_c0_g2_i1.p1 TRINITY_DN7895_c0_g2~~TRINITY_DN7895_c0_g2_i1.p1  ORF type:complete len:164 (-),score=18.72 TRINITY_DN7895_c0_g2_i1:78-515(-)
MDPIVFLTRASGPERGAFLGVLAASKTAGWALAVAGVARWRSRYVRLLWKPSGLLQRGAAYFQGRFPEWSRRVDMAVERVGEAARKSRSAGVLCRALGTPPEQLAPALAEGSVLFRCVWPLWCPCQVWLMLKYWPYQDDWTDPAS